jgi:hypothetical protein
MGREAWRCNSSGGVPEFRPCTAKQKFRSTGRDPDKNIVWIKMIPSSIKCSIVIP